MQAQSVLVLGVGNILLKDEGLGVHIVNQIEEEGKLEGKAEILDGGTAGYDLMPHLMGREKIIIVDALKTDDEPGSVYHFPADRLAHSGAKSFSLHDVGIRQVVDMLKLMGEEPQIEIIGVVPEDISSYEVGLSDSVREAIPKVIAQIYKATTH